MAYTAAENKAIADFVAANINNPAAIAAKANELGVSAQAIAAATGFSPTEVNSYFGTANLSVPQETAAPAAAPAEKWDYNVYQKNLKTGDVDYTQMLGTLGAQSPVMAQNAQNIYKEILAQQQAGTADYWYAGDTASKEAAASDFALRLAENGIGSLSELGQTQTTDIEGNPVTQYINKATGEALPRQDLLGRGLSALDIDYQVAFNDQGQAIPYTTNRQSGWVQFRDAVAPIAAMVAGSLIAPGLGSAIGSATGATGATLNALTGATMGAGGAALTGEDVLKGAFLGGAGGYLTGGGLSDLTGTGDFAGINSSLTPAQIESGLGTPGYGYGAQAASSGLFNPAVIGSGAYTQTSYPYDYADLVAADTKQLFDQVGANAPAIEQNLIASGVDPLVAADAANQVILNPGLSVSDLTNYINTNYTGTGGVYDVNTANVYPTTTLPGAGGLLSQVPGASTTAATTTPTTTTTTTTPSASDISTVLKALGASGLLGGAVSNIGGAGAGVAPTQGVPMNNADYYNAIQQYYNTYMPTQPRDVATPLQQWYSGAYKQQA